MSDFEPTATAYTGHIDVLTLPVTTDRTENTFMCLQGR